MITYRLLYLLGGIVLAYVFYEIYKRTRKIPLAILIARQENAPPVIDITKKQDSFSKRAERVGWDAGRNYLEISLLVGAVIGAIASYAFKSWMPLVIFVPVGMVFPYYKLSQKEEIYFDELPMCADQALGAVEQQIDSDIPIFEALKQAVPYMQEPLKSKYEKVVEKVEKTGIPLKRALEGIPEELGLAQLEYFHVILEVAEETEEKARDIISDASDMIRRQQKQANRLKREIASSRSEMKLMFGLVCVMVGSYIFMSPSSLKFTQTLASKVLDVAIIGFSGLSVWSTLKKIQTKNLF